MNSRLDQDKTEFGVFVLAIDFEMLADGNRLFDEVPKVLRDGWAKSCPQTKGMCNNTQCKKNAREEYVKKSNKKSGV